jgi:hypothetical protein
MLGGIGGVNVDADPNNNRLPYDDRFVTNSIDTSYATGINFSKMKAWAFRHRRLRTGRWLSAEIDHGLSISTGQPASMPMARRSTSWNSLFGLKNWQFSQELQLVGQTLDNKLKFVLGGYYFKERSHMNDYVTFDQGLIQIDGPNYRHQELCFLRAGRL